MDAHVASVDFAYDLHLNVGVIAGEAVVIFDRLTDG
jgi:hypothetical protein